METDILSSLMWMTREGGRSVDYARKEGFIEMIYGSWDYLRDHGKFKRAYL